ncbi:hypothetical protein PHLCEN_2v6279 [Hermanssonia centrifuga]|uniref:Uncharacterized protein n=1 Tax=Hermanssonia centrifuga TaxID=98765 RepID=A0A2R6NZY1_9APHY|nr:hypothetical protein PHLCEN_2v6279 [Hermanssonia centrifuga]
MVQLLPVLLEHDNYVKILERLCNISSVTLTFEDVERLSIRFIQDALCDPAICTHDNRLIPMFIAHRNQPQVFFPVVHFLMASRTTAEPPIHQMNTLPYDLPYDMLRIIFSTPWATDLSESFPIAQSEQSLWANIVLSASEWAIAGAPVFDAIYGGLGRDCKIIALFHVETLD